MTETSTSGRPSTTQTDWAEYTRTLFAEIREHGRPISGFFAGRPVLLLTTTGRRSGQPRTSALAYSLDGDRIVVVASKSGAPENPDWFGNLVADPEVTVEMDKRVIRARASVTEGDERQRLWDRHAAIHPQFNDYPARTERVIPVVVLEPIAG